MPNPLMNRQINLSRKPRDHEPEPLAPDVEEYDYGKVTPVSYRGAVDHGVYSDNQVEPPEGYEPEDSDVEYALEPPVPDPVPVRIVQSTGREIRAWRVFRAYADTGSLISDEVPEQSKITLRNMSTDTVVFVGDSRETGNSMHGYPLTPGNELVLNTTRAVYASSEDGSQQPVSVVREFVIRED